MTANVGEIVAQLREAIERIDQASVAASRAQKDAAEAHGAFATAGQGSEHPKIRQAITDAAEAQAKAGKLARLYAEAANAFTDYINLIAPGSAPARKAAGGSTPSGEDLVSDAEARASKGDRFVKKQVTKADDIQDSVQKAEKGGREIYKHLKDPGPGTGQPSTQSPAPAQQETPQVDNPVTAIVMATGALAVAAKSMWDSSKKHRERKKSDDDEA